MLIINVIIFIFNKYSDFVKYNSTFVLTNQQQYEKRLKNFSDLLL